MVTIRRECTVFDIYSGFSGAACGDTEFLVERTVDGTGTATDDGFMSAYGFYNDLSANTASR